MDFFNSTELTIPISQIILLLSLSTLSLLFGKIKLGLLINYIFTMYWGFICHRDLLLDMAEQSSIYMYFYFGFGLLVIILAMIGFIFQHYE